MLIVRLRTTNFGAAVARMRELGGTFTGFDHRAGRFVDLVLPAGAEAAVRADPKFQVIDPVPSHRAAS